MINLVAHCNYFSKISRLQAWEEGRRRQKDGVNGRGMGRGGLEQRGNWEMEGSGRARNEVRKEHENWAKETEG